MSAAEKLFTDIQAETQIGTNGLFGVTSNVNTGKQ